MKNTENDRICFNCRFFFDEGKQCRRYPPQIGYDTNCDFSDGTFSAYPRVHRDEWCGEFKIKG